MKLQKFLLKSFDDKLPDPIIYMDVPEGSKLLKALVLHDGIYLMYEVPSMQMTTSRIDSYTIILPDQDIPADATFLDLLGIIAEGEGGAQSVVLYTIYRRSKGRALSIVKD